MKKVLLTATVQSHIAQFHKPLINMLKENGYEVHVAAKNNLAEKNGLKLNEPNKVFNVYFDRSPFSKKNIMAYKAIKQILSEGSYDIVHCNTPMAGVITRLAANKHREKGLKVFYTAHGFHFYKGAPVKNWMVYYPIEKLLAHYTDELITITKEDYEFASRKFKTNVVHVHGVGVNSNRYYPYPKDNIVKLKRQLGYSKCQLILLCIGELNKNKNQTTVIKVIAEVVKYIPNIKLLLAGNGPMDQKLKSLVNELNLKNNVDFLGYRTDLEKYVNICDFIISSSFREGLPLNIMEGMLCGKPVIASMNRGHCELIDNDTTGYLVKPDDINGFVNHILTLSKDEAKIKKIGINALRTIAAFTSNNVLVELKEVYKII